MLVRIIAPPLLLCVLIVQAQAQIELPSVAALRQSRIAADVRLSGYYGPGTAGGGDLRLVPGDMTSRDNGCTLFVNAAGSRFRRPASPLPVTNCGARGDGRTDDTHAEWAALLAVPTGGRITWPESRGCYRTSASLTVAKSVSLSGPGTICAIMSAALFQVRSSNVSFAGLKLTGAQSAIYRAAENAILATGEFRPGRAPQFITDLSIRNLVIRHFGAAAIQADYVRDFTFTNNIIQDLPYGGIVVLSGIGGEISGNRVSQISGAGAPGSDAYGIMVSRETQDAGELVSQPRSADIRIQDNVVDGIPTWAGLNTHSGQNIVFHRNTIRNTYFGIAVGASRSAAHTEYLYAPLNITVSDNNLDSTVTDGSRATGISFTGAVKEMATGTITGNTVKGYGHATTAADGAILAYSTANLVIRHNIVERPSPNGVALTGNNRDTNISENTISDSFTNADAVGAVHGIYTTGDDNESHIYGNTIRDTGAMKARFRLVTGSGGALRLAPGRHNSVLLGENPSNATLPLINAGEIPVRHSGKR